MIAQTFVVACLLQISLTSAGYIDSWSGCVRPDVMAGFNMTKFTGTWYEMYRMKNAYYSRGEFGTS